MYLLDVYQEDLVEELKSRGISEVRVSKKIVNEVVGEGVYIRMELLATAVDVKNDVKVVCTIVTKSDPISVRKELNKWVNEKWSEFERCMKEAGIECKRGEWIGKVEEER